MRTEKGKIIKKLLISFILIMGFIFALSLYNNQTLAATKFPGGKGKEKENMKKKAKEEKTPVFSGCPGQRMRQFDRRNSAPAVSADNSLTSELRQWPVQIKLVPTKAPYFDGAKLLIAADCTAYAYANFHHDFIKGKITVVGCPKLDDIDYSKKLTEIIQNNDIQSVTVVRMEVPCCGGLEHAAKTALQNSGKFIPWQVVTISTDGQILD